MDQKCSRAIAARIFSLIGIIITAPVALASNTRRSQIDLMHSSCSLTLLQASICLVNENKQARHRPNLRLWLGPACSMSLITVYGIRWALIFTGHLHRLYGFLTHPDQVRHETTWDASTENVLFMFACSSRHTDLTLNAKQHSKISKPLNIEENLTRPLKSSFNSSNNQTQNFDIYAYTE